MGSITSAEEKENLLATASKIRKTRIKSNKAGGKADGLNPTATLRILV